MELKRHIHEYCMKRGVCQSGACYIAVVRRTKGKTRRNQGGFNRDAALVMLMPAPGRKAAEQATGKLEHGGDGQHDGEGGLQRGGAAGAR